jgi:pepF/M3 family oligoendopeptidase
MKKWDLSQLYSDFDSPQIQADLKRVAGLIADARKTISNLRLEDNDLGQKLLKLQENRDEIQELLDGLHNFGHLSYATDTSNHMAAKLIENVEALLPQHTLLEAELILFLKDIPDLDRIIDTTSGLSDYKFVLNEEKKAGEHLLSRDEELLLAELTNTGSSAWGRLQDQIVSSLTGEYDNKPTTLTVLRSKAYDKDSTIRRSAYEAELSAYTKKERESAACLNAIKGEVITVAKKRRYATPLEMTLEASRMDKETLDAMLTAIVEYLPFFRKYLSKKASLLGHKNGLPFYDLFAPVGSVDIRYSYDEARDYIVKHFTHFSESLGTFAQNAFDQNWIDPFPKDNKVAGAFCSNIHKIGQSRILSNFTDSFNDMTTLAHELGHGYHGECLKDAKALNADYPMPLAETASIFCETIVFQAALEEASPEEAKVILENDLMGSTQVIVDIYSRYLFETSLFEKRKDSSLSVDELKETMIKAQKEAYGDALDANYLHPYMWMCKPHYYEASTNFYNFPYAFGLLFAKGLFNIYQNDKEAFIPRYNQLLKSTGSHSIHDVLSIMGIDSHDPEFFRSSLELIKNDIDYFIRLD